MGKFASNDSGNLSGTDPARWPRGIWSAPAYFNDTVYYGSNGTNLKAFPISNAKVARPLRQRATHAFGYPGTTPSISANGTANGIVWTEAGGTGVRHAYDATKLSTELYDSNQAGARDQFSDSRSDKFVTPMIANGKVYVGTAGAVVVLSD